MIGVERIGRYEVLSHLASGGMGQVYLARATGLGGFERQVVIKTLDVNDPDDDVLVTMFLDEARVVGALHHQHIAPVYEVGCDIEGRYFLVMDYVRGETAEGVWHASNARGAVIPLGFTLTIGTAVASALDYAHALRTADGTPLSIVHRDVSLSNVMVGHDGAVKLIDFGIAKAANRSTTTQVGTLKGKMGYVAPEMILRRPVDHRADIFALGIVLYELSTMKRAFREASDLLTLERITRGEVTPPSQLVAGFPRRLEAIILKALSVDPDDRFQDAGTMGAELDELAHRLGERLGDVAVVDVMANLFDSHGGRRRFPRASNEVSTGPSRADDDRTAAPEVDDVELITEPRGVTLPPVPEPEPGAAPRGDTEPSPLVVRIVRPVTVTAQVARPVAQPAEPVVRGRRISPWLVACVALAVALALVLALAL